MEMEVLKYVGAGLAAIGMLGSGIGLGILFGNYLNAVARQPEMESKLKPMLFFGMAMVEAIALFAFVIAMMVMFA